MSSSENYMDIYCTNCLRWFDAPRHIVLHRATMWEPEESILVCPECGGEESWEEAQKCDTAKCIEFALPDEDYCKTCLPQS